MQLIYTYPDYKLHSLVTAFLLLVTINISAQWQNTFQARADDENTAGVVVYSAANPAVVAGYISVGNTKSFTSSGTEQILLIRYNAAGVRLWSKIINDPARPTEHYHANDIQPASDIASSGANPPPPTGLFAAIGTATVKCTENSDLYICGYRRANRSALRSAVLIKVNSAGTVLWARSEFATITTNLQDETAVSVETEPKGDVFVVGQVRNPATGLSQVMVSRLKSTGQLRWSSRYASAGAADSAYDFIPKQSCLFKEPKNLVGIAVTGTINNNRIPGVPPSQAFVMRIHASGAEQFRVSSFPVNLSCTGEDIMLDSTLDIATSTNTFNFVSVAHALVPAGAGGNFCYLFPTTTIGAVLPGFKISDAGNAALYPQSICADNLNSGGSYVIAGEYLSATGTGNTYLMRVSKAGIVAWSNTYPLTKTNNAATESAYPSVNSYYIATNAGPVTTTAKDPHSIVTNSAGQVTSNCAEVPFLATTVQVTGYTTYIPYPVPITRQITRSPESADTSAAEFYCVKENSCTCASWSYTVACPPVPPCMYKLELKVNDAACEALGVISKTFSWSFDANLTANSSGNGSNADSSDVFLCVNTSGSYSACLTINYTFADGSSCTRKLCKPVEIICIAGAPKTPQPYLSPNPAKDFITVLNAEHLQYPCQVVITDMENHIYLSKKIYTASALKNMKLDFSRTGLFVMQITDAASSVYSLRFLKQ